MCPCHWSNPTISLCYGRSFLFHSVVEQWVSPDALRQLAELYRQGRCASIYTTVPPTPLTSTLMTLRTLTHLWRQVVFSDWVFRKDNSIRCRIGPGDVIAPVQARRAGRVVSATAHSGPRSSCDYRKRSLSSHEVALREGVQGPGANRRHRS